MPAVAAIIDYLQRFAPLERAADWDNVGLILGERSAPVQRVLTCLTVTPEVVAEAVQGGVQMIITHHPMLFRAVKKLTDDTAEGRMALALVRAGIAVYSPHTAFDNCAGGINDLLCERLGLRDVVGLRPFDGSKQFKIVVFVPEADLARVSNAMFAAGAGQIGNYTECSFRTAGTGTFFGSDAANPAVGQKGRREEVSEWRLEALCRVERVDGVVAAMRRAHSYEEPAFDVYPLFPMREKLGDGRSGNVPAPMRLADLAGSVRTVLKCGPVQVVGDLGRSVSHVAVACGAAGEFLSDAAVQKADVFITGEMRFHDYLTANVFGISLILPGHYASERLGVEILAKSISGKFSELVVSASLAESDPVHFV